MPVGDGLVFKEVAFSPSATNSLSSQDSQEEKKKRDDAEAISRDDEESDLECPVCFQIAFPPVKQIHSAALHAPTL